MADYNNNNVIALKEWAIVCKTLEAGKQIILLRKGGIMEYKQGFKIPHKEFLLYPTFEHQSESSIKKKYRKVFENMSINKKKNIINLFAEVHSVIEITDEEILIDLQNYHIWTKEYIESRMRYNPKKPMSILLLRVYKLNEPLIMDIKDEWSGCKSWIDLKNEKIFNNNKKDIMKPVLHDSIFNKLVKEINEVIVT
ncbi:MAG: DUF1802 family protein [Nitrososphaeraceae archaeon]